MPVPPVLLPTVPPSVIPPSVIPPSAVPPLPVDAPPFPPLVAVTVPAVVPSPPLPTVEPALVPNELVELLPLELTELFVADAAVVVPCDELALEFSVLLAYVAPVPPLPVMPELEPSAGCVGLEHAAKKKVHSTKEKGKGVRLASGLLEFAEGMPVNGYASPKTSMTCPVTG